MTVFLQPVLVPVKGAPDLILSIDPKNPEELFVFLGMALLEKIPRLQEHLGFKMLLARLYNAGVSGRRIKDTFGVARTTLRRWGRALKSGDLERIRKAFCGQGAQKKITTQIEEYVRDRFGELHGHCRDYNQRIQAEVQKYFKVSVSSERLRWIFQEERSKLATIKKSDGDGIEHVAQPQQEAKELGAHGCEKGSENSAIAPLLPVTRNYSLPPNGLPCSGRRAPEKPTLCHHAGILLMSDWIDVLSNGWVLHPNLVRQWVGQVLLGAVNHEQSKRLSFSSLEWLIGPMIGSVNHQRRLLGVLAEKQMAGMLLERNGRLLDLSTQDLFYFDPHAEEYTGVLKTLKGWSGGLHRVKKIINMDFIHTEKGEPCFVQHADNFYDMRERFFMAARTFQGVLGNAKRTLTWVIDRGIYGLDTLRRIVDDLGDDFITWEKNYKQDGWDEKAQVHSFEKMRVRNHAEDLRCYGFRWQEHPWPRDPQFQRLIVRAMNPSGRDIEVAILTSHANGDRLCVIWVMFNRWLQENDFGYMNRHVGINELTSRAHENYASIGNELEDRQVQSREYKTLRREKMCAESALGKLLVKRKKLLGVHAEEILAEQAECNALKSQIKKLTEASEETQEREVKKRRGALARQVAKHQANEAKRSKKQNALTQRIDDQTRELDEAEKRLSESVREESRLQALIDEQYFRLDTRRKAFMDAIRISCRNIFCKLAMEFRPLYNNYRDDHFIVRELTRASGIIEQRDGIAHILLMPTMEFPPATRRIVRRFLAQTSQRINEHFAGRSIPLRIDLLTEESNDIEIDQCGLECVASQP